MDEYLIGVRLREVAQADDYKLVGDDLDVHVGDLVVVETGTAELVGEVRRPKRALAVTKRDRLYHRVLRLATEAEAAAWRERREREKRDIVTCQRLARAAGMQMKVVDVERSEEHTSELQSLAYLVCRLLLEKKKKSKQQDVRR